MEKEEDEFISGEFSFGDNENFGLGEGSSNTGFCLVFEDDVREENDPENTDKADAGLDDSASFEKVQAQETTNIDVEAIKKKADEIASSLQKFRSANKSLDTVDKPSNYEPPEEFKRYHEKSLYLAQKLKEDRLLFEESKKRNEAVFDKVRSVKRMHKDISEISKEENVSFDEIHSLKQKIERLENSVEHLQESLEEKNQIIFEKNETIRNLNDSVTSTYNAHMNALEQSQEEITRMKREYAKNLEKIAYSKEQFCNQLQTVRQKYLQVENDLKLSDFARCRLVSRNAQLREKINQLESENEELKNVVVEKENNKENEAEEKSFVPGPNYICKDIINPKLEGIQIILNEFYSFLADSALSNSEFVDEDCCIEDDDFVTKSIDRMSDKLESMFYLAKDKIFSITEIEENLRQSNDRIKEFEKLNEESKQQEIKLKKLLASLKLKLQTESNQSKELLEELNRAKKRIEILENQLTSQDLEDWKTKYIELEKTNEVISHQMNVLREKVQALEFVEASASKEDQLETLKNECARLHDENNEVAMMLEMKGRDYDTLMAQYENLRKAQEDGNSSDKTENDFVVLQKKDAECEDKDDDTWKEKYEALCEDNDKLMSTIRTMSEKTIEWENEKLNLRNYQEEYQNAVESLKAAQYQIEELIQEKKKAEKEIDNLNRKLDFLEAQLIDSQEMAVEQSLSENLKERLKHAEELNDKLKQEIEELKLKGNIEEMKSVVCALEEEKKKLLEECEKFKVKYQRLQVYCKANINKSDKSESTSTGGDAEKLRIKCKELLVENKQLKESLKKISASREDTSLLQLENSELQEKLKTLVEENNERNDLRVACAELKTSNDRLKEALVNLQKEINIKQEEIDRLIEKNQTQREPFVQTSESDPFKEESNLESQSDVVNEFRRLQREHQAQQEEYIEAMQRIDMLNANLAQAQQSGGNDQTIRELEWFREEYQSQKEYILQYTEQLQSLSQENEYLKEIRKQSEEQYAAVCEEVQKIKQELEKLTSENQNLDATNEQLMEFCNRARQQIALLTENDEACGIEIRNLRDRCDELEAANKLLENSQPTDESSRLRSENELLVANNEHLMEFCNNAKQRISELELVKVSYDELLDKVNVMSTNYEAELNDLRHQLQFSNNTKMSFESELALTNEKLSTYHQQLLEKTENLEQVQLELENTKEELKKFRAHVERVQYDAMGLVAKCTSEVDRLNLTIENLTAENDALKKRYHSYDEYVEFYEKMNPIIEQVRNKSEEAFQIVDKLQNEKTISSNKGVQCDNLLESTRKIYEEALEKEKNKYDSMLSLVLSRVNDLVECWDRVEKKFTEKEQILLHYKILVEEKRIKCEDARQNAGTDSLTYQAMVNEERAKYERSLAEIQQNQTHDLERYKSVINEERSKYESIITEMQENLQHYKSLVEEERAKYERMIFEMQQNADKVNSENYLTALEQERANFDRIIYDVEQQTESERTRYENMIYEYQQKLEDYVILLKEKDLKSIENASTQFYESDLPSKIDFYDKNASHQVSELKMFDTKQSKEEGVPNVKKYFDYCKDKIKKEIKDILQPDEVIGDWADEPPVDVEESLPLKASDQFSTVLEQLKNKFAKTTFSSEWSINDNLDDFHIALQLADLFQLVVTYYIDTPKSRESPYALELLKKFKDVSSIAGDPIEISDSGIPTVPEERINQLMFTVQMFEQENKYLIDAVTFLENLLTDYSNFENEVQITDLIHRWHRNISVDSENYIIDKNYDAEFIKAFNQWKESNVKRIEVLGIRLEIRDSDRSAENILVDVYKIQENVKNKLHDLICDLHYVYSSENSQVNPVEFFEQIEDINHLVEQSLKIIVNDESLRQEGDDEHQHSHDEYDESQSDGISERHGHIHDDKADNTVLELKSLLAESNKKIESLVKELMDVKNSKEYNEVKQLHLKLDETLYQLHVRDVHCVELTQELTQLLSERDSLQLKLSTILRQNEELREASMSSEVVDRDPSNLETKLVELQKVNYMKDPRISEASKLHHTSQMQLFNDDSSESNRSKERESGGFSVPSLFKWITGDTEEK